MQLNTVGAGFTDQTFDMSLTLRDAYDNFLGATDINCPVGQFGFPDCAIAFMVNNVAQEPTSCSPTHWAPASGSTISSSVLVTIVPNCNAAAESGGLLIRNWLPDTSYNEGLGFSWTLDNTKFANCSGPACGLGIQIYDPSGSTLYGETQDHFTIANGSSGSQPVDNPPLPPGTTHWAPTCDVDFISGSTRNLNRGNGTPSGPPPWWGPGNDDPSTAFGFVGASVSDDCEEYFGTAGMPPYNTIISCNVLGRQMKPCVAAPGGGCIGGYLGTFCAWLQSQDVFTQQFGPWEISAEQPHDNNGEGDGYHTEIWLTSPDRTNLGRQRHFLPGGS
jgi:hypothetical protein